ncbi:MAG: NADH-quinone oxidoreductase subunit J [Candidatus Zixiibacteriota bacterium]|nr:MAG: NADH-quinone oxidoreductase subunit J [candidate division Zixibacteria bacterium]
MVIFYILGAAILIAALLVVTLRNIFHSALFLVATFFLVAGIYVMLSAEFLAAVQVLIYVGAVTVLILFAIMLTHNIFAKAVRQVNEQVLPAIIIAGLLLAISIFTIVRTFGDAPQKSENRGSWTATFDTEKLPQESDLYGWSARLQDEDGKDYSAYGSFRVVDEAARLGPGTKLKSGNGAGNGYIISSNAGFSSLDTIFSRGQNIYFMIWSEDVDYRLISNAEWHIFNADWDEEEPWRLLSSISDEDIVTIQLSNSNSESIGRLLMSTFVLPFEVVSVLLLAALMGAIIIARKDD